MITLLAALLFQAQGLDEIRSALAERDYPRAEQLAHAYIRRNERDPLGWFYIAFARAAQERFEEAIGGYGEAIQRGLAGYQIEYQLAYCMHRTGRHALAASHFQQALAAKPDDPDSLYFLGVSQLELGRSADSERTFSKLLERETSWSELARFHRGLARLRQDRESSAREDFRWVVSRGQDEELRTRVQDLLDPPQTTEPRTTRAPEKTWSLVFYEKAGYDTNVVTLPETSVSTNTGEADFFLMTFASGSLRLEEQDRLTLRLSLLDITYAEQRESDLDAMLGTLETTAPLGSAASLEMSAHGELYALDRRTLFHRMGLRSAVRVAFSERLHGRVGGDVMSKDFQQTSLDFLDSRELVAFAEVELKDIAGPWTRTTVRYDFHSETADADDQSYVEHRVTLGLHFQLAQPLGLRLEGFVRFRENEDVDLMLGEQRQDDRVGGRLAVTYRIGDVQVVVEAESEENDSTLDPYAYDRKVYTVGVLLVF